MSWQLKPKPDLEALEEMISERGLNRDDFPILKDIPQLLPECEFLWESFGILSASRQLGFSSAQPISLTEISVYMELREIYHPDDRVEFLGMMQRMDRVFLAEMGKKKPQSSGTPPPPPRRRR